MPQAGNKVNPPPFLTQSTLAALRELQLEELGIERDLSRYHNQVFQTYREQLQRQWLGHLVTPADQPPVWDPVSAQQDGMVDEVVDSYAELATAITDTDTEQFADDFDAAFEEGHRRELWLFALGGIPGADYADTLPEPEERSRILLAAGIAGLSWLDRMQSWRDETTRKMTQWMAATINGGRSLDDTLEGYDRLTQQFDHRISGLFGNELYRAYNLGGEIALTAVQQDHAIAEVWMTRQDKLVCFICAPKHLTVTPDQPVTDSHPACRCWKVPVPEPYRESPVSYVAFLRQLEQQA